MGIIYAKIEMIYNVLSLDDYTYTIQREFT